MPREAGVPALVRGRMRLSFRCMEAPRQLSHEAVDEFKAIYQSEFGDTLSDGQAEQMALSVLRLFDLLSQPMSDDPDNEVKPVDS